ncbi:MAG: DUF2177 family protein [Ideonella sp.]
MSSSGWTTSQMLAAYAITFVVFAAVDALWLGWIAKDLYRREMGELMASSPRLIPAVLFYVAYPIAIVYFGVSNQALQGISSLVITLIHCAALGLFAYGTYDLTNMSVVRNFSVKLGLIDIAWGTFASGVSGLAAFAALRWWGSRG